MKYITSLFIGFLMCQQAFAINVLDSLVRPNWPSEYKTVHAVANYFLEPYGYRLVVRDAISKQVAAYSPAIRRDPTKTMTIKEALLRMVPPEFSIVVDVDSKRITYDLTKSHVTTFTVTVPKVSETIPKDKQKRFYLNTKNVTSTGASNND